MTTGVRHRAVALAARLQFLFRDGTGRRRALLPAAFLLAAGRLGQALGLGNGTGRGDQQAQGDRQLGAQVPLSIRRDNRVAV
jgi:hypothetical protein